MNSDGCVRAVCCTCDCVNYVLEPQELSDAFRRVAACLESGGVFIFDMNTAYKYEQLLGDHTFAESRQEGSFIWENYYDEETRINEYDLTLFIPEAGELYRRYAETHYQRNYKVEQIVDFLQQADWSVKECMMITPTPGSKPTVSVSHLLQEKNKGEMIHGRLYC